jgi:hypothetical protein
MRAGQRITIRAEQNSITMRAGQNSITMRAGQRLFMRVTADDFRVTFKNIYHRPAARVSLNLSMRFKAATDAVYSSQ